MRALLGWSSIVSVIWSLVTMGVGLTDQAIYFSLLGIYGLLLAKMTE